MLYHFKTHLKTRLQYFLHRLQVIARWCYTIGAPKSSSRGNCWFFNNCRKLSHKILRIKYHRIYIIRRSANFCCNVHKKMTKLCCFKRNSPAVLTLSKVASTNNREESVSSVARVNVLTNSSTDFHALSQPLSKTRHNLVHWTFWQIITETSVLFDMTIKRITTHSLTHSLLRLTSWGP